MNTRRRRGDSDHQEKENEDGARPTQGRTFGRRSRDNEATPTQNENRKPSQRAGRCSRENEAPPPSKNQTRKPSQESQEPAAPAPGVDVNESFGALTQRYDEMATQAAGASNAVVAMSDEEKDKLVSEVMRHMLFKNAQLPGVPVKRDELLAIVNKHYARKHGLASAIITAAQAKFPHAWGFEMKEINKTKTANTGRPKAATAAGAEPKLYVLKSVLQAESLDTFVYTDEDKRRQGFLKACLLLLHTSTSPVGEALFWCYLKKLGVDRDDKDHTQLGNVEELIKTFIQQRYIFERKANETDLDTVTYELGDQAMQVIDNEALQKMTCQLMEGQR